MSAKSTHSAGPVGLFTLASLLLTFFVALMAISNRDIERARDASKSFNDRLKPVAGPVTIIPIAGNAPAVKVIERRWLDIFPGAGMAQGRVFDAGQVLRAELGAAGIFVPGRAETLPSAAPVLAALSRIVGDAPPGVELSLDVKLGLGADAQADGGKLAIQRARTLARILGASDLGGGDIAVGLQRGHSSVIALELRLASRPVAMQPATAPPLAAQPPTSRPGA